MSDLLPDWLNAETCIENAQIAYDDSLCDEDDFPIDTVISSGDLGVLIGLAKYALAARKLPSEQELRAADQTFSLHYNSNCPAPFLVRLPRGALDLKKYADTNDACGFGKTFAEAFGNAREAMTVGHR